MYYVYALKSVEHNRVYIGITKNLRNRVKEHNSGKTKSTRFYKPWVLFYSELADSRITARKREKQLKSGYGKEFLKNRRNDKLFNAPVAHTDRARVS
ncbi:MAG: GIY-YIG nuclease family protein [Candidatus Omnitrophica bacterium]|nr:GIY-YIG nuclease family protein [Candidatus Omnitrophota bacterium]